MADVKLKLLIKRIKKTLRIIRQTCSHPIQLSPCPLTTPNTHGTRLRVGPNQGSAPAFLGPHFVISLTLPYRAVPLREAKEAPVEPADGKQFQTQLASFFFPASRRDKTGPRTAKTQRHHPSATAMSTHHSSATTTTNRPMANNPEPSRRQIIST